MSHSRPTLQSRRWPLAACCEAQQKHRTEHWDAWHQNTRKAVLAAHVGGPPTRAPQADAGTPPEHPEWVQGSALASAQAPQPPNNRRAGQGQIKRLSTEQALKAVRAKARRGRRWG